MDPVRYYDEHTHFCPTCGTGHRDHLYRCALIPSIVCLSCIRIGHSTPSSAGVRARIKVQS